VKTHREAMLEAERVYCLSVLELTHGNVSAAARIAGKNRTDFYKVMRRHNLRGAGELHPIKLNLSCTAT